MNQIYQSHHILIFILLLTFPILYFFSNSTLPFFPRHQQRPIPTPDEYYDLALFNRAISTVRSSSSLKFTPFKHPTLKIAFLFLTNSDLYLSPLWARFFNDSDYVNMFNIYIHADPGVSVADPGGVFSDKFIVGKHTERSSATLISASRRLLATAIIDDPLNFYFALISQSCIPLHSFEYVYNTLFSNAGSRILGYKLKYKSYIEIIDNGVTLPSRYVARGENVMLPEVPYDKFRVGSQFFVLTKKHALMILKERKLWRKFKLPCLKVSSCYPEEHYFQTYLSMVDLDGCSKYSITRVNWTDSVDGHPHTYRKHEVSPELIYSLRESSFGHDYLFARKFSPDCLEPLLGIADSVIFKD